MSKIKVTVNSISQANEIIEYWSDKEVELYVGVKENTTDENSDVLIGKVLNLGTKSRNYRYLKLSYDTKNKLTIIFSFIAIFLSIISLFKKS